MCGRQQVAGVTVECSELSVHIRGTITPRYGKNAASVLLIIASTMASTGPCTLEGEARGVSCSSQASQRPRQQPSQHSPQKLCQSPALAPETSVAGTGATTCTCSSSTLFRDGARRPLHGQSATHGLTQLKSEATSQQQLPNRMSPSTVA